MKLNVHKGKTSKMVLIFVQDSSKTDGSGLAGLTNASSGLVCYRWREDDGNANGTQLSLSAGTRGTWSSGGFKEKDATHMAGTYELGLDNAGLASGSDSVVYMISGATNMAPVLLEIQLTDFDPQDSVRLGLTALPNVASGSAGAIPTTGSGANQLHVDGAGNVYSVDSSGSALATLASVSNIAVTGAALNKIASSETLTTGTDTGGVGNTNTLDGVFDSWADAAGTIDGYYQFDLSGTTGATAVGVTWDGYLAGTVNTLKVYAYNWGAAGWDQVGTITGIAGTVVGAQEWDLTSAHTGTGGNAGLVRIRFNNTGLVAATLKTDRILLGYAVVLTPPANWSSMAITAGGIASADVQTIKTQAVTCAASVTVLASIGTAATSTAQTGDSYARLGASAGASIAADLAEIEAETDTLLAGVTVTTNNDKTGYSLTQAFPSNFSALLISGSGHVSNVDTLTTYTGNTLQTGDSFARLGAPAGASIAADLAEIEAETDSIPSAVAIATAVWQDLTAGADFGTAGSIGALLVADITVSVLSIYNRIGAPTGASIAADVATVKSDTGTLATRIPGTVQPQTGDSFARLGAPAGASIAADLAEIEGETDTLVGGVTVTTNNDKSGYSLSQAFPANFAVLSIDANGRVEVQSGVTKNVSLPNFEFLLTSSADHFSPLVGAVVTATRSIDGGAFGACANAVSEVGNGIYKINLAAADLNGGVITLRFTAAGADDRFFTVVTSP